MEDKYMIAQYMGAKILEKDGRFYKYDYKGNIVGSTPITIWGTKEETFKCELQRMTAPYGRWGKYDFDWNELMPVIQKLEQSYGYIFTWMEKSQYLRVILFKDGDKIMDAQIFDLSKIEAHYQAVVRILKCLKNEQ